MTDRPTQSSTTGLRAPSPAPATAVAVQPGERLRLAEAAEPATFTLDHGKATVGRVRMWTDGEIRLSLGERELRMRPDGRGHGLTLSDAAKDAPTLARFEDRRLRGDLLHAGERTFSFTDDDEHLCDEQGARLATFTARAPAPRNRVVLADLLAPLGLGEEEGAVLAFAAVIVLLRRLPATSPRRFGMDGGRAAPGQGVWIAGALGGHADGSF